MATGREKRTKRARVDSRSFVPPVESRRENEREDNDENEDQEELVPSVESRRDNEREDNVENENQEELERPLLQANNSMDFGRTMQANSIEDSTRRQYERKIAHVIAWFKKFHAEMIDDANEVCPIIPGRLTGEVLVEFLGYCCMKRDEEGRARDPPVFYSYQHVNGYHSAIVYYMKHMCYVVISQSMTNGLQLFMKGYQRKIEKLKTDGESPIQEGKAPLSFEGVQYLSKKALKSGDMIGIFAHTFLLLCWNLIARCVSVSTLNYDHISWEEDCMTITFPTHKGMNF